MLLCLGYRVELVTFAAPPVGNEAFARALQKFVAIGRLSTARAILACDPVPKLLPWFTHHGQAITLDCAWTDRLLAVTEVAVSVSAAITDPPENISDWVGVFCDTAGPFLKAHLWETTSAS